MLKQAFDCLWALAIAGALNSFGVALAQGDGCMGRDWQLKVHVRLDGRPPRTERPLQIREIYSDAARFLDSKGDTVLSLKQDLACPIQLEAVHPDTEYRVRDPWNGKWLIDKKLYSNRVLPVDVCSVGQCNCPDSNCVPPERLPRIYDECKQLAEFVDNPEQRESFMDQCVKGKSKKSASKRPLLPVLVNAFAPFLPAPQDVTNRLLEAAQAYREGRELAQQYQYRDAIRHFERALSISRVPAFYLALGLAYSGLGEWESARENFREGLDEAERGGNEKYQAVLSNELGRALLREGNYGEALEHAMTALNISREAAEKDAENIARNALLVAQIHKELGTEEDLRKALEFGNEALKFDTQAGSEPDVARDTLFLGQVRIAQACAGGERCDPQDLDRARKLVLEAHKENRRIHGRRDPIVATSFNELGAIHARMAETFDRERQKSQKEDSLDEAFDNFRKAIRIWEDNFGSYFPAIATAAKNIGYVLYQRGRYDKAMEYARRALTVDVLVYTPEHPNVARDYNLIGVIHVGKDELDSARRSLGRALDIATKSLPEKHPDRIEYANTLCEIERAVGTSNQDTPCPIE